MYNIIDHGHTCLYIPWYKTMYYQAMKINRSNLSECTPTSTTLDLDSLHRFPVGKRKFQRTRTSFVTGQIVVLERGTYLIYFVSNILVDIVTGILEELHSHQLR